MDGEPTTTVDGRYEPPEHDPPRIKQLLQDYGSDAPVHNCVAKQATFYCREYERIRVPDPPPFITSVTIAPSHTATARERIEEAVRAVEPQPKQCFANALQLWDENPDFTYVEGFAAVDGQEYPYKHAWNLIDGTFVDATPVEPFDEYYGIVFDDPDHLRRCVEIGQEQGVWGVLGNHRDNHQYLRDHGFL